MFDIELLSVTGQVLKAEAVALNNVRIGGLILNNLSLIHISEPTRPY